mgnify:CR=1 FL=1
MKECSESALCSVAILNQGYNEQRNIASTEQFGVELIRGHDRIHILRKFWHRVSGKSYSKLLHSVSWPVGTGETIIHTFNGIVIPKVPWVVSFETTLPRESSLPDFLVRKAWRKLAAPNCLGILALSESARARFDADLTGNRAGISDGEILRIQAKLEVLHPPQEPLLSLEDKMNGLGFDGPLKLALVGHDFYRKGGLELLIALDSLLEKGREIELNIAGRMRAGDYASRAGVDEEEQARKIIARHPRQIRMLGSLSGSEVLNLFKASHIVCLPTWGETYGYSVLEGQASGCAAITTDLRALPEINSPHCGWVIPVPKLPNGDGDLNSVEKRLEFRRVLVSGLEKSLSDANDDRRGLMAKAQASLERIRKYHDPSHHSKRRMDIYQGSHACTH